MLYRRLGHSLVSGVFDKSFWNSLPASLGDTITLDKYCYTCYNHSISRLSLSFSLKSESLPPTSTEAAQNSFRTFLTVPQRKGNQISWIQQNRDDAFGTTFWSSLLELIKMSADSILNLVSCGCKAGCSKTCGCTKTGLHCMPQVILSLLCPRPNRGGGILNCKFRGQKVKIIRPINAHIVNAQYLLK